MTVFGYCRVSTPQQDCSVQFESLLAAGVLTDNITIEVGSGVKRRPKLERILGAAKRGDSLIVWRLDRIARSVPELLQIVQDLDARGVRLLSVKDSIDLSNATGRLLVALLAVLAGFERDLLAERTRAGQELARRRGVRFGRPRKLTPSLIALVRKAHTDPDVTVDETAQALNISRSSYYSALRLSAPPPENTERRCEQSEMPSP